MAGDGGRGTRSKYTENADVETCFSRMSENLKAHQIELKSAGGKFEGFGITKMAVRRARRVAAWRLHQPLSPPSATARLRHCRPGPVG